MIAVTQLLDDGRVLRVTLETGWWSACLDGDPKTLVHGVPLEGILMETFGLNPAHDDTPETLANLARRVRADCPRSYWPSEESD